MAEYRRTRRYYLHKRLFSNAICDLALRDVWRAKQEAEPGTALPSGFPHKAALEAAGYTTVQDIDGADQDELRKYVSLRPYEADAVIAAAAALL